MKKFKWRRLLFMSTAVVIPLTAIPMVTSCSTKDIVDNILPDQNQTEEQKIKLTTCYMDTILLRNGTNFDGSKVQAWDIKKEKYTWDIWQESFSQEEGRDAIHSPYFVSLGVTNTYIKENGQLGSAPQKWQIPALNFSGKDIEFVVDEKDTPKENIPYVTHKITGHYVIKNAYVEWYYKDGIKYNEKKALTDLKLYAAKNPNDITEQMQEIKQTWKPALVFNK